MSCSARDNGGTWLRVKTSVACPAKCELRPGQSGRHDVEVDNRGPLGARFEIKGTCQGALLQYLRGLKSWTSTVTVPARLFDHKRTVWETVQLPNPCAIGPSGTQEEVEVTVTRFRGGEYEESVTLTLQLQLKP